MKVNLRVTGRLKNLDGTSIEYKDRWMTKTDAVTNALLFDYSKMPAVAGEEKLRRFKLARTIFAARGDIELSVEDIALIKLLVSNSYPPLISGQVWETIDPRKIELDTSDWGVDKLISPEDAIAIRKARLASMNNDLPATEGEGG